MNSYPKKLKDPRWQKVRLKVFERDEFKCACCGNHESPLHVHHLVYTKGEPWDSPMDILETLCEDCHRFREEFNGICASLQWKRSSVPTRFIMRFCRYVSLKRKRPIPMEKLGYDFNRFFRCMEAETDAEAAAIALEGLK